MLFNEVYKMCIIRIDSILGIFFSCCWSNSLVELKETQKTNMEFFSCLLSQIKYSNSKKYDKIKSCNISALFILKKVLHTSLCGTLFQWERNIEGLPGDTSKWIQRGIAVIWFKLFKSESRIYWSESIKYLTWYKYY